MIKNLYSSNPVRLVAVDAMVIMLLLDRLFPVSASATEGGALNNESNDSRQINTPAGPTSSPSEAAGVSHALALRHNTTKASLSELFWPAECLVRPGQRSHQAT